MNLKFKEKELVYTPHGVARVLYCPPSKWSGEVVYTCVDINTNITRNYWISELEKLEQKTMKYTFNERVEILGAIADTEGVIFDIELDILGGATRYTLRGDSGVTYTVTGRRLRKLNPKMFEKGDKVYSIVSQITYEVVQIEGENRVVLESPESDFLTINQSGQHIGHASNAAQVFYKMGRHPKSITFHIPQKHNPMPPAVPGTPIYVWNNNENNKFVRITTGRFTTAGSIICYNNGSIRGDTTPWHQWENIKGL